MTHLLDAVRGPQFHPSEVPRQRGAGDLRQPFERRNQASRELLLRRVRAEFDELQGLTLTLAQGMRLFGLREDVCRRVFDTLIAEGYMRQTPHRMYARN
jgi:hypothetical protein